ncbi:MAG: RNase adapter RapZ [Halanaerobium sp.]|nr:RNase adapter RapZ [Halanaerobium sp.]
MEEKHFLIITGMSGAGKTQALKIIEDMGYFCIDNLPPALISKFGQLIGHSGEKLQRVAVVIDIRGRGFFDHLVQELEGLEREGLNYQILFLEASDQTLVRRYKETRRRHPLATEGGIMEAIEQERVQLQEIRGMANKIIDTSQMSPRELKEELKKSFVPAGDAPQINISVISFGFKYGIPIDADLVFDVRFLPNPHYVQKLKPLTGRDQSVQDYVFKWPKTQEFKNKFFSLIDFLVPQYIQEGKSHLTIAIGCTGGQHRSVALAIKLGERLRSRGYQVIIDHRDLKKVTDS